MSKIRVRLLGGFEVWAGDRQVGGFESQKVRALLVYLVCQRRRAFSRDHLAGLLWPEREPESARHALRQAVYNLRSKLAEGGSPLVVSNHLEIGLAPESDCWLDVEAFEEALRRGTEPEALDPHHLSAAVQLYRGEFLAGFFVRDSPSFEDWQVTEQVRLREAAVEVLQRLIDTYRRRGEYRFGVHYARRLVAIDPLSEEAHRELMRLCALSGQRNRALAHYEDLLNLLRDQLGVEPLEETRTLYESILVQRVEEESVSRSEEPIGPLIPLAGRGEGYEKLRDGWLRALQGSMQFTLVLGEGGVGKTRLIKSFVDATTSTRRTSVLKGRCYELSPLVPYQPFIEILRSALSEETELADQALAVASGEVLEDLVRLVPEMRELRPDLPAPAPLTGAEGRRRLFGSVARFLEGLCAGGDPLILFLDDLQLADRDTLDLLMFLTAKLEGPIWMVAICHPDELDQDHPIHQIVRYGESKGRAGRLEIERLGAAALEEIAESLVGEGQTAELASFLEEHSSGLPLAVTEIINYLWDEGILVAQEAGRWALARSLRDLDIPRDLDELTRIRVRRLPNSTKRLATLAAIIGQSFDVHLLQESADEHVAVIEIGLEILLKRWLVRQFAYTWTSARRERDIVLWAQGARRGTFEFAHKRIRGAVYRELNPLRRQAMHSQVAEALEGLRGTQDSEALAFHFAAAGLWEKALPSLERAVERALSVLAVDTARRYCDQAIEVLSRLAAGARSEAQATRWRDERERMREIRKRAVLEPAVLA
ncbi:MAG TPA: BTAD domain-containing putative transcriptional regulator [Thermoanaerobaculia bacterium]|nr:BTAD domain-containing putative transcriptional regulator [Thermoanaerobaculia bacterium]